MASTSPAEIALLHELVAIPSVSGDEEPIARFIETTVRGWGLDVVRDATGVKVEVRAQEAGPDARAGVARRRGSAGSGVDS